MNNEFKPNNKIRISLQNGYSGGRLSFELSRPGFIAISVFIVVLLGLSISALFLQISQQKMLSRLEVLSSENDELREKLDIYSAVIDSIATHLQLESWPINDPGNTSVFPYISNKSEHETITPFAYDTFLSTRIKQIENNLKLIQMNIQAPQSTDIAIRSFNDAGGDISIPSIYPTFGRISDGWGMRIHPIYRRLAFHYGIDFANDPGTPVYATAPGVVAYVGYESDYGKLIKIEHQGGYETRYGHLNSYLIKEGDNVKRGQIIGLMGSTGVSTGPHLHYEILVDGRKTNPAGYLNRLDDKVFVRN